MKTLNKITGTTDTVTNLTALTGLLIVTLLIISFTVLAVINGIKPF